MKWTMATRVKQGLTKINKSTKKGFSLIELMLVLGLMGILLAAVVPYMRTLNTTWNVFESQSDNLQNSRVALDYFNKEFKQAYRIQEISDASDATGHIIFDKANGTTVHFLADTSGTDTVFSMQESGVNYEIAGPISHLSFTAYDEDGAITTINSKIKTVDMNIQMQTASVASEILTTSVTLPRDIVESLYYSMFSNSSISLSGSGSIDGHIHSNGSLSESGSSISISGDKTDASITADVDFPSVSINELIAPYENLATYEAIADVIVTSNYTFTQGNTYEGIYYIGNGADAYIEQNVVINGSVIAEGDVEFWGRGSEINPSSNVPAVIAGDDITVLSVLSMSVTAGGTMYAHDDFIMLGGSVDVQGNGQYNIAIAAGDDITTAIGLTPTVVGTILAGDDMNMLWFSSLNVTGTSTLPAMIAGDDINLYNWWGSANLDGIIYTGGNFSNECKTTTLTGSIISEGDISLEKTVYFTYDPNYLKSPPIYFWEDN